MPRPVWADDLDEVQDEFTLSAKRLSDIGDAQVWDAVWGRQGRGLSIVPVGGWIARIGGVTAKSTASPKAAVTAAKRNLKRAVVERLHGNHKAVAV